MTIRWAELCAGAAATTLQLLGGPRVSPVVSWMGGKRRHAPAILAAMGLQTRQPDVESVLLADAGPWGWVWPALLDREMAAAVATVLRGWEGRDPRELWDDLAARPPAEDLAERTAGWLWLQARAASGVPVWWAGGWRMGEEPSKARRRTRTMSQGGGNAATSPATVAGRIDAIAETVATWLCLQAGGWQGKPVVVRDGLWVTHGYGRPSAEARYRSGSCWSVGRVLSAVESLPAAPGWAVYHGDAADIADAIVGRVTHVYLDPPYVGRTGYGWDLERDRVLELADRLAHAGAVVAVSEAEPLDLPGWHHVDLSPCSRRGAGPEWLTLSRPPAAVPAAQLDLLEALWR